MIGGERELLPSQRRNGHEHNVKIEEEMFMDQKNNGVFVLIVNYFLVLKPPQKMIHVLVFFGMPKNGNFSSVLKMTCVFISCVCPRVRR